MTTAEQIQAYRSSQRFVPSNVYGQAAAIALTGNMQSLQGFMRSEGYPMNGAWCGQFAASVVTSAGGTPPANPQVASNWRTWGTPVTDPQPGDIAVLRGAATGNTGSHVTFVGEIDPATGTFVRYGGNQGPNRSSRVNSGRLSDYTFYRDVAGLSRPQMQQAVQSFLSPTVPSVPFFDPVQSQGLGGPIGSPAAPDWGQSLPPIPGQQLGIESNPFGPSFPSTQLPPDAYSGFQGFDLGQPLPASAFDFRSPSTFEMPPSDYSRPSPAYDFSNMAGGNYGTPIYGSGPSGWGGDFSPGPALSTDYGSLYGHDQYYTPPIQSPQYDLSTMDPIYQQQRPFGFGGDLSLGQDLNTDYSTLYGHDNYGARDYGQEWQNASNQFGLGNFYYDAQGNIVGMTPNQDWSQNASQGQQPWTANAQGPNTWDQNAAPDPYAGIGHGPTTPGYTPGTAQDPNRYPASAPTMGQGFGIRTNPFGGIAPGGTSSGGYRNPNGTAFNPAHLTGPGGGTVVGMAGFGTGLSGVNGWLRVGMGGPNPQTDVRSSRNFY